ncbi:MAG: hypothetical protein K8S20_12990 [Chloroflexi bacterium]|nr:hypothetical protein [Chloroflexota bacterium]
MEFERFFFLSFGIHHHLPRLEVSPRSERCTANSATNNAIPNTHHDQFLNMKGFRKTIETTKSIITDLLLRIAPILLSQASKKMLGTSNKKHITIGTRIYLETSSMLNLFWLLTISCGLTIRTTR